MSPPDTSSPVLVSITRRALIVFAALLLAPWLLVWAIWRDTGTPVTQRPQFTSGNSPHVVPSSRGPWGDLEVLRIVTEPPESCVLSYLAHDKTRWVFGSYTREALNALLDNVGLAPAEKATLLETATWDSSGTGCVLNPTDGTVLSLSPGSRAILYGALSMEPGNPLQNEPFRFRSDIQDEWLENSGLPEDVIARVRSLSYQRGITVLFSDVPLVLPMLKTDPEKIRLLKVLSRQSTLLVSVKVTPETDVAALEAYWGKKEGRAKDIRPLLESLTKIPGGHKLDVVHLLPRFARKRLYVYASASGGDAGEGVFDCHWSTMNFWNDPPDDRFGNLDFVTQVIETEYEPVLDEFRFGDIILFMKSNTQAIHSAIYLADDILYTKNGPTQKSPWILMKLETLTSYYETNMDLTIRGFRKKGW